MPAQCTVYTVTSINGNSGEVSVAAYTPSNIIPAYTPVLIERKNVGDEENNGVTELTETICAAYSQDGTEKEAIQKEEDFWSIGNVTDAAVTSLTTEWGDEGYYYILLNNEFVLVDEDAGLAAHRCVLKMIPQIPNTAPRLHIVVNEETTGIVQLRTEELELRTEELELRNDTWYTLDGRKLEKQPTMKGLYIHNGRKVVIK